MEHSALHINVRPMLEKKFGTRIILNDVARDTGLSRHTVTDWWNGTVTAFRADTLIIWCKYLQCDVGDLLTYQG